MHLEMGSAPGEGKYTWREEVHLGMVRPGRRCTPGICGVTVVLTSRAVLPQRTVGKNRGSLSDGKVSCEERTSELKGQMN